MNVDFTKYEGGGNIVAWIEAACKLAGVPYTGYWLKGMETLTQRESSWLPNAVNTWDSNANGPVAADGHPLNCSRGLAQVIPSTFSMYRAPTGSWQIYDPVANIAAAINYVRHHYGVMQDGSNLASRVQQADPNRHPRGY